MKPGDRVAYTAKFLKNIGAHAGSAPERRGLLVKFDEVSPGFARVKWEDFEARSAELAARYGQDYVDDVRANGALVNRDVITKVGSSRFGCTDV